MRHGAAGARSAAAPRRGRRVAWPFAASHVLCWWSGAGSPFSLGWFYTDVVCPTTGAHTCTYKIYARPPGIQRGADLRLRAGYPESCSREVCELMSSDTLGGGLETHLLHVSVWEPARDEELCGLPPGREPPAEQEAEPEASLEPHAQRAFIRLALGVLAPHDLESATCPHELLCHSDGCFAGTCTASRAASPAAEGTNHEPDGDRAKGLGVPRDRDGLVQAGVLKLDGGGLCTEGWGQARARRMRR